MYNIFTMDEIYSGEQLLHDDSENRNRKFTIKFRNFQKPENSAVIYLKFKQRGQTLGYFVKKDANGITNSEDSDQTAPLGAV